MSTNFFVELSPVMMCILSFGITKCFANFCISSLLALPLSGLDFKDIVISFP